MSFGMVLLRESLRTQLLQGRTWLLLFLLPLMIWGSARLLPAEEAGVPAAAAAYLLALWTLWLVFRVVGRQDWLWLRGMLFQ